MMIQENERINKMSYFKHKTMKRIMSIQMTERTDEEEKCLEEIIAQAKFFQDKNMKYDDFKDLVRNFQFQQYNAGDNVIEINTMGENFYIILKGLVSVLVKNPIVKNWNFEYKHY